MREEYGNAVNTIAKNLQILQRIMKSAAKEGIISTADDPFLHYQIKMEKTTKQKLSIEKIEALPALEEESRIKLTRDAFLFSFFYCAGIRFGDLCQLTWSNVKGQRIEYQMSRRERPSR